MEAAESTLLDFVEKVRGWIPRRADPSNISRDFWMPDRSCRVCYECESQFSLFNRRHHCRICGRVFCRRCTQNTIPVSGDGRKNDSAEDGERIKVCNFCFKLWKQEIAPQSNGFQLPPTPPPQAICPSPSATSLDSSSSSTVYPTGPYQHISSSSVAKSPQANGFEPLPGGKQEDILHSERNTSALSSVEGVSSPSLLVYCVSRSDDEGDEYSKDVEDAQEGLLRHSQEYFGEHASVDLHSGYILQNVCANNTNSQSSMNQAVQLHGLSSVENISEDVLSKSPSFQNDILVEQQMSCRSERSAEETEDTENFNDCNDDSVMFQSRNSEREQPFDFENNGAIWVPPEPEDVEDEIETSMIDEDDDDEDGSWGLAHSSGSFSSNEFKSKERSSEDHREAMRTVLDGHFRALVAQLLKGADVSVGEENYNESWLEIVTSLSWQAATFVKPDTSKGGGMDPGGYVKVKCIASGRRSDSKVIKGIVCSKNVKHKRMTQRYKNPRMLLLGGALEYQRVSNQLSSFETLLQQEMDHLKMTVARIEAHRPNVLLVEKTVSHHAQEYLLSKEISLVLNVKKNLLERIARCTGAEIVPSLDNLAAPKVGHCELFHVDRFLEEHGCAGQSGKKQAKTLMFFEGCPRRLGCTVLLMGASRDQLKKVKHVVQYAVFAAYHLALETCFLADEGATLPELPLKSPINVALPDKQLSLDRSISMIPNSAVPTPEQNKGEMQNLKMYKAMSTVSALADDPLIDNNKGESKPPLTSGGMGPPMSHVTSKSSPDGTCLVQTEFVFKKSSIGDTCAQVTGVQWDPYPSGQEPSLPTTPSGDLSGLSASIKAYSNEIISPAGPGSYGAVMSYLELEDKESKDSDLANGFTVSVSSKVNLNHQITTEELSGKVAWENQGVAEKEMKSKVFPDEELLGYRNQEQVFSKEDFPPSPSDHQSILVLLSSRCVLKGTLCERSQLFRIKYYGSFDKPLGRYLRDDLFDQNSRCRFCNEPSEAHVLCYTHHQGSLTISVRQLPLLLTLPGEREGKIWMWHRCLKCARKDGVPEATRRVVMSDAAWGLSFGKFLELSFSNHAAASRVASCGHSLHRDCLRFYGFGSMIACFRYSSINVLSVHLPPSKLEFHDPHQQGWLKKEAAEVAEKVEMLFREVFNLLCQIGQKIATSGSFYSGIKVPESRRQIAELEGMLHKEIVEFEGLLQEAIISDGQDGRPVADISKLNSIRRLLLYEAYEWDRRLCHLDSSLRVKNSLAKLESSPLEDFKTPHKEYDSTINEKVGDSQGTVKDSNNSSGGFGIPMTEDTGSTVDGNCLDSAICSGNLQFKVIQAGNKHVLNNVNGQLSMTSNVDNSCLCDHLEGTGTVNGKLDEGMEIIKSAEGKTTQNLDDMEGGPYIRDSSSMTNGTMFHTFDMENGECDTSINVSETMPFETVDSRDNSNGLDEDLGTCRKLSEQDSPMLADLSDTLDAAWTGEGQSVKAQAVPATSQGQEVGYVTLTTVTSGSESADTKDFHPVQQIAIGDRMMSESTLNMQDKGGIEVPEKSIPPSPVKSLNLSEEFGSWIGAPMSNLPKSYSKSLQENLLGSIRVDSLRSYSPMFVSSVSHLGGNGVGKLLLPTGVNDMVIAVYDDEPTSIIAYALSSQEYQACLYDKAPDSEKQKEIDRDKEKECADLSGMGGVVSNPLWPSDGSLDSSKVLSKERSSGSEDIYTYGSKGNVGSDSSLYTKDTHAKISFHDEGPPRKVKYSVTCYYAKQFDALRKKCCPTEMDFRLSLSRCKKWGAQGGKSNVFFAKSLDERFIIKQVTRTELESFMKFASEYFKYLSVSLSSGSPTCLAKILGIYQVTIKNAKGGKEIRMELMVMENLLFGRKVTRVYDLKGSGRSRYNADSSGNNKVLLDQNLLETMPTAPIFLGNKAKRLLERAVWNDTSFLGSIDVMDYSLLVGVDEERCELVLGIIDFMRQYTWDKHLETWVKASGILGGPKNISPTVISPKQYKKRFRKAMSTYFLMVPDQWSPPAEALGVPLYVGQYPQLLEDGSMRSPTQAEYLGHFIAEEKIFQHSHAVIDLLMKAYEQYKLAKSGRMVYCIGCEMGQEYFAAREYVNAKRLFDSVAGLYRQESWVTLLWVCLGSLKECARKLSLLKEYIEYSLEMAALPILSDLELEANTLQNEDAPAGPFSYSQRAKIHKEVIGILQGTISDIPALEGTSCLSVTESGPIFLEIDLVSPLRAVLLAYVAFHEQVVKPGGMTSFTLSLLTHLPLPMEINELEIQFNQLPCNFLVISEKRQASVNTPKTRNLRVETVPDLELEPNKWKRLSFNVNAGLSGKLECLSVIARIGQHSTICCRAESPASREDLPLWKFEDRLETLPMRDGSLSLFGQKVIQVEDPEPLVDVVLSASGPGFVGELFPVSVLVNSKGHAIHAGELKINIVDSKVSSMASPRETASTSLQSYHVELLIVQSNGEQLERVTRDEENFQRCSGILAVPFIDVGTSWSTQLFIKWHKPKLVTLFVSLGYQASQKIHVHKSLQLEGRIPITVSHRYMTPFRRDSLLLENVKNKTSSDLDVSLALNEANVLVVTARNFTEVPLRLISIIVEEEDGSLCSVRQAGETYAGSLSVATADLEHYHAEPEAERGSITESDLSFLLMPNEAYRQIFSVCPSVTSSALGVGTVCIRWKRDMESMKLFSQEKARDVSHFQPEVTIDSPTVTTTQVKLSSVRVEKPPLVVSLECPSHALFGAPFTLAWKIQNETKCLQEVRFSLVDSQSFLVSGAHSDTISILPYSSHLLSYKLVPLASGLLQLPQVNLTATRYSASFHPPTASTQLFVFPSNPHLKSGPFTSGLAIVNSG